MLLAALFAGCAKSELTQQAVVEGQDTQVALSIGVDGVWSDNETKSYGLNTVQEQEIKSIDILIYNSDQRLVSRHRFSGTPALTNNIITKSGSGMSIYVIANLNQVVNANGTPNDVLGMPTTLTELKNIKITNILSDIAANGTLIMTGAIENVTISNIGSLIDVPLDYVAAKVTVNFRNTLPVGETFDLVDWKLGSLARYGYLFPRANDVVDVGVDADFITQTSTNTWEDGTIIVGGAPVAVKTTTFYLLENRRGKTTNTNPQLKSGSTAPSRATRLLATGYHKTNTGVTGVNVNLMFGENSFDDYNVKRGYNYTFNVTVIGLNNFAVDTRYTNSGVGFQADVVSPTMDAHYDYRPLRITAYPGTSVVTILDGNGNLTNSSFWLKISKKNITKFINNGSGTYIRTTYNPASDMLQTEAAIHSVVGAMDAQMLYLYADEFLTDGASRNATVRVVHTQTNGTVLAPVNIAIVQRGILMAGFVGMRVMTAPGTLSNVDYRLGLEVIEEAAISITPGNLANERTMTMQFGFSGSQPITTNTYTLRNGFDNTLIMSLSDIPNGVLRAPYGRTGASTISHQFYDAIYNTHAARYCFEKNRDINGDGVIKGAEIKWYLPSTEEQLLIYAGGDSWSPVVADRWTGSNIYTASSQISSAQNMAAIFSSGMTGLNTTTAPAYVRCVRRVSVL